jgi:alpha-1,6-mannosyltransferase
MPDQDVGRIAGPLAEIDRDARLRLLLLVGAALAVCVASGLQALFAKSHDGYLLSVLLAGVVYAVGVWVVVTARLGSRALLVILLIALGLRAIAIFAPIGITTDSYRYVWDGRIQAAGVNPYLTFPGDARLTHLRDAEVFPNINGKDSYPTIYPPLAQIAFLVATRIHDSVTGVKILTLLCEAGIIAALLGWLAAARLPRERVLIYAWHPLPLWEFTGHGHIDAVAVLAVTLAFTAVARRRSALAGAAFAAAFFVKYWPVYLAAAAWRRWDWRMIAGSVVCLAVLLLPYLAPEIIGFGFAGVSPEKLIGSLFTHLNDEGYNQEGWGFFLAYAPKHFGWWVMSGPTYGKLAAAGLLLLGLWAAFLAKERGVFATQGSDPTPGVLPALLVGAFLMAVSPHYPWYYAMAVPLLARSLVLPLLWVTLTVPLIYVEIDYVWLTPYPRFKAYLIIYGGFLVLSALVFWWRQAAVTSRR